MKIKGTKPCDSCPYLKATSLGYWDRAEFKGLLSEDKSQFGKIYGCHKKDDTICRGWLINQENRGLPNINLRLSLLRQNISRDYLDTLIFDSTIYSTVEEMSEANFPGMTD